MPQRPLVFQAQDAETGLLVRRTDGDFRFDFDFKRLPCSDATQRQRFFGMGFHIILQRAEIIHFQAVDGDNTVARPQAGQFRRTVGSQISHDQIVSRTDLDFSQAFAFPEFRRLLARLGIEIKHLAVPLNPDWNDFLHAAYNAPHDAIAHP